MTQIMVLIEWVKAIEWEAATTYAAFLTAIFLPLPPIILAG
jgi:hypothetical protein